MIGTGGAEYMDIQQTYFVWYKADKGYYWDDEARVGGLFVKTDNSRPSTGPQPPFLVETPDTTGFIGYKPLDEPTLFLKFAEIQPTQEGILAFANSYGKLTLGETELLTPQYSYPKDRQDDKPWKHGNVMGRYEQRDGKMYGGGFGESLQFWREEIKYMRWTVQVWEWLKNRDTKSLRKVIFWPKNNNSVGYVLADKEVLEGYSSARNIFKDLGFKKTFACTMGQLASSDFKENIFARFRPGDVLLPAQYLVQSRINKKLEEYATKPRLLMNDENKLEPYLMPENLLAAMWLQFYLAAIGEKKYKRCSICGLWADVTDKRRNWSKHSDCANQARVRKYREKQREVQSNGR